MTEKKSNAALIVIGNEILSGRTQDKNINYLAKKLGEIGVRFEEVRIIPDIHQTIIDTVNELRKRFSYVFTTGGIGPTHDDITTECVAKAFSVELARHEESYQKLHDYYKGELNEGRVKMVMLPEGAEAIANPISTAPGYYIDNVYVMAGIPNVMQAMFDSICANLKGGAILKSKELKVYASESKIASVLTTAQDANPDIEIGSYPFVENNKIGVSVVLRGADEDELARLYGELEKEIG